MNTNTKYYTPELHEFHVGFEFERELVDCNWNHSAWQKETVTSETNLKVIEEYKNYNRVKHLDREDIESLGFSEHTTSTKTRQIFNRIIERYIYWIDFFVNENKIRITINDSVVFHGDLKNKSELQRIMVQTGIK